MLVTGATVAGTTLLMAAESATPDIAGSLLQYGVLGLVVVLLLARRLLVPAWVLTEVEAERDRLRAELATLRAAIEERDARTFAALTAAVDQLKQATTAAVVTPKRTAR